jgi:hypothetical protein
MLECHLTKYSSGEAIKVVLDHQFALPLRAMLRLMVVLTLGVIDRELRV